MARNSLINKKSVRQFLLDYADRSRRHKYSRVGEQAYDRIEHAVREECRRLVHEQPSAGKTIK